MPKWKDLKRFLINDHWSHVQSRSGTDEAYQKTLSDGTFLETRVSRGSKEIGSGLFAKILKTQLKVSKEYFNRVLGNSKYRSDDPERRK